jgi:hypothetical protein
MDNFNSWQSLGSRFRKLQPAQGDRLCAAWDAMDQSWFLRNRPDSSWSKTLKMSSRTQLDSGRKAEGGESHQGRP